MKKDKSQRGHSQKWNAAKPRRMMGNDLKPYRWVMLANLWLVYVSFGLIMSSASPLITPIIKDLGISYGQMGFILGSWQLSYIAVAFIAGIIIDHWGVRKSLFLGTVFIGLSEALRCFANGFETLLLAVALFGVGGPLISVGAPKTISVWFSGKDRGTAVGLYMTGPWVGSILAFAGTNKYVMPLTGYSWRLTFIVYGFVTLGVAFLWWCFAKDVKTARTTESIGIHQAFLKLLKVRNVRIILALGVLSLTVGHGYTNWLPKILENAGMSPAKAGFAASLSLFTSIPAILIIPRLVPSPLRGRCIALLALLTSAATSLLMVPSQILLLTGILLFGVTQRIIAPLLILMLMEDPEVGSRYMGSAGGMFFCVSEIGGVMGPALVGNLVDRTGTFTAGICLLAGFSLSVFAVTLLLKTPAASRQKSL